MKILFHCIIEHNGKQVDIKPLDCDYIHAQSYVIALRKVFKGEDGWHVFIENVNAKEW